MAKTMVEKFSQKSLGKMNDGVTKFVNKSVKTKVTATLQNSH